MIVGRLGDAGTAHSYPPPMQSSSLNPARTWTADKVRQTFIDFYAKKHAHTFVPSSPCVPHDDPTLLFTNAGMNQFKPIFLGQAAPGSPMAKLKRAVNSQKCIRAGGKHNDLEDVGKDTYHHTFFEMLGTWSFGDYFKEESIAWGWELLTKVFGIPEDRLYVTYFAGSPNANLDPDWEAREIWKKFLPSERVIPGNMKDNFWEMGDTGPCGPCSEIHFDRIGGRNAADLVNKGDPDVLEIWNHVFIQFNRESPTKLTPLPAKHVDTGMGFERLTSVLQNVRSNYDTDVFAPLFMAIERITRAKKPYTGRLGAADKDNTDTAYRVIADHIRTLSFAITDGAVPSNEGRGYVLRRILRRAVRFGSQILGAEPGFMSKLVPTVVEHMGEFFPELRAQTAKITEIILDEELSFGRTLARGILHFDEACVRAFTKARLIPHLQMANAKVSSSKDQGGWTIAIHDAAGHKLHAQANVTEIDAAWADSHYGPNRAMATEDVFKLYDTYGFPVDLTVLMAEERGLRVDMDGFNKLMEEAKDKARAGSKFGGGSTEMTLKPDAIARLKHMNIEPTDDLDKFRARDIRASVVAIWNGSEFVESHTISGGIDHVGVILDKTNFCAEMGGQVADEGRLAVLREARSSGRGDGDDASLGAGEFRVEDVKSFAGYVLHIGRVTRKEIRVGDDVQVSLDSKRRSAIASNHTATHLLNLALRSALGPGVDQKGSQVAPDKLRFDFSHGAPVKPEELASIQKQVDAAVAANLAVHTAVLPLDKAKSAKGVRAVFGEAYPDPVRVVSIGRTAEQLIKADEQTGLSTSAEFCGGTHVSSTGEIQHFVLASEEGVAKGVRRITALTGVPAQAASAAGHAVAARLSAAASLDGAALAKEAKDIAQQLESLTLPLVQKHHLRQQTEALAEKVKAAGKQASAAKSTEIAKVASAMADSTEWDNGSFIVSTIDAGSDRDALTAAMNAFRTKRPRHAVLLISPDAEGGKLNILAQSTDATIKRGLSAGDWVKVTAAACGGKGGGKPDAAQGGGTDVSKLKEALMAAKSHAFGKLPN